MKMKLYWYYLSVISSFCLISLIWFDHFPSNQDSWSIPAECDECFQSEVDKFTVSYRRCLFDKLNNSDVTFWKRLPAKIQSCLAHEKFSKAFNLTRIESQSGDGSKFVILPPTKRSSVVAVTARPNSGGRGSAEQELCRIAPKCKLHVADPNLGTWPFSNYDGWPWYHLGMRSFVRGMIYADPRRKLYDKVISFADVGDEKWLTFVGKYNATEEVTDNLFALFKYRMTTLKKFLEKDVNVSQVDYLWIDDYTTYRFWKRGKWYHDPPTCFPQYSILEEPFNITVCQVSLSTIISEKDGEIDLMELAWPTFKELILSTILSSQFLPIHSKFSKKRGTLLTTYMNMASPYCLKKFLAPTFCANHQCPVYKLEDEWKNFQDTINEFEKNLMKFETEFAEFL